ncbi:SMI1/KNR4 family protein [Pseudomonas sp. TH10]|nr:SMI1/KNR4 family protein [Pseudomonas sp. TH10]
MPIVYKAGLNSVEVAFVEKEVVRTFSPEYRAFLMKMNGFYLAAPDFAQIPLAAVDDGYVVFDRFFGWLPEEECNDLICFNKEFVGELDFLEEAVAIGEDGGGNPYVLIGKVGCQSVYYWDRTHLHEFDSKNQFDIPEQNDSGNLFYISGSFSEFFDLIVSSVGGTSKFLKEI